MFERLRDLRSEAIPIRTTGREAHDAEEEARCEGLLEEHPAPTDYYVYVIELDDAVGERVRADKPAVYVGQSAVAPEERYAQHRRGYRSSRYVRNHGVRLRPKLYRNYNPLPDRDTALATEAHLADRLRKRGFTVFGGH